MADPLLTVAIATYNRADDLKRCIASVLAEPGDYFDVLIGDDCSPDHTPAVVEPFLVDPRVRHYRNPANLGMRDNYLKLLGEARGRFAFILTDDDWMLPGALDKVRAIVQDHPDVGYILSHLTTIDERTGRVSGEHRTFAESRRIAPGLDALARVMGSAWVLSRQVVRRDLIDWETWRANKDNIFFPMIVAGRLMLAAPSYYLADHLVRHTWFNRVYWQAFGRDQLQIDLNLAVDRHRCMRAVLHDAGDGADVRRMIRQWELECFTGYVHPEQSGLYDAIRSEGVGAAIGRLRRSFPMGWREWLEVARFFALLPLKRGWVALKRLARRLAPGLFYGLKALKDQR